MEVLAGGILGPFVMAGQMVLAHVVFLSIQRGLSLEPSWPIFIGALIFAGLLVGVPLGLWSTRVAFGATVTGLLAVFIVVRDYSQSDEPQSTFGIVTALAACLRLGVPLIVGVGVGHTIRRRRESRGETSHAVS